MYGYKKKHLDVFLEKGPFIAMLNVNHEKQSIYSIDKGNPEIEILEMCSICKKKVI